MPTIRQTNFSGGELDPLLWGRTDLEVFGRGLRTCRNFFVSRHGAAVSRPGTRYCGAAKLNSEVRLIAFDDGGSSGVVLEVGDYYLRPWRDGGRLGSVEVATPWDAGGLKWLTWAQVGDVMTFCHPQFPAQELRRYSDSNWVLSPLSFSKAEWFGPNEVRLQSPVDSPDVTHPAKEWTWMATALFRDAAGVVYETAPTRVRYMSLTASGPNTGDAPSQVVLYPDRPRLIMFSDPGLLSEKLIGYRIYRGRGGLYGWVGDTEQVSGGVAYFVDTGQEPDYARCAPKGENPFVVLDQNDAVVRTETPQSVTFFQERRCFGGTIYRPATLFCSKVGDYDDFDSRFVQLADEALVLELATRKREEIRALVGLDRLLALTGQAVWAISGQQGEPLSFDFVDARVVEDIGSSWLRPLVLGDAALYARTKGYGVRALLPAPARAGYEGADLSAVSQHLFVDRSAGVTRTILDWCYQEDPWGLVWAVRSDGSLLSLTFDAASKTWAWARHDMEGPEEAGADEVVAVCSVPEGDEDVVYLAVKRWVLGGSSFAQTTYLERMVSRVAQPWLALDCVVFRQMCPGLTVTGLGALEGREVWVVAANNPPQGPYTVSNGAITLDIRPTPNSADYGECGQLVDLYVGLLFTPELETLDVAHADVRLKQKTVKRVGLEVDQSRGLWAGPDFSHLVEWRQRSVAASYGVPSVATELVVIDVPGRWDASARIALRQTMPLPVTVVGLSRDLDVGG